ncbi:MAG: single-stranded DNA-binding protein [Oscillospiraceae bacterium]|jgi:single-strand DNA-binding protein|nr:single-stranded DNA-binding protein [Oscillospiraceae bacterium]
MLNHIVVMGRFTRDPELRTTQTNVPVVSFTVAVERDFTDKDTGTRQTDFIDCVAWRSTAEFIARNFGKGKMAVVSGRLQLRDWLDKEGQKRRSAEIVADNIYFGESRRDGEDRSGGYGGGYNQGGYGGGYNQGDGYGAGGSQGGYGAGSSQGGYGAGGSNALPSGASYQGQSSADGNKFADEPSNQDSYTPTPTQPGNSSSRSEPAFTELDDPELPF